MTMLWVVLGTLLGFGLVVALILLWARGRVQAQKGQDGQKTSRQRYLDMAAHAAADPSGLALVKLLNALDDAPADCPVTAQWVRHLPANKPPGMLVRISWDGNEWRRVMPWDAFRDQLRAVVGQDPESGTRVRQLLADLETTP